MGLNLQRHEILKSKIASTLQPQTLRGKFPSHIIPQNPSSTQRFTFRPVCCLSYAMIDIGPGETLIFAILPSATVPCSSLCMIILYGGSPINITKNKPGPSNLHCIVIRLGGFHTLKICLGYWITSWGVESLVITLTYAENTVTHLRRQCFLHRVVRGHILEDDGLNKLYIAAKMLGMIPPVDSLGPGSWWQDCWCRSRCTAVDEC